MVKVSLIDLSCMCNFTDISLSDTSLVLTSANSTHTCVVYEGSASCSSHHQSVLTYTDMITHATIVKRLRNEAACINTRSCGVWSLDNSKQYTIHNCESSLWDEA